ncbi:MAG TPA: oxidoreductase, partial [Pseudoneobacillus sp.]|nr:oxidoreductase [Pseudoneobacillus sp.]
SILIDKISTPENVEIRFKNGTVESISQLQDKPSMYYEVEEFINLIKTGKTESEVNSYRNSKITAQVIEEVRKQMGLIFPADQNGNE